MWPLISRSSTCAAWRSASSGESANWTPPAFMRPPVSTWDLITTGFAISSAIRRASSAVVAKPCGETGMPARATIWRDSYSKKRIERGSLPRRASHGDGSSPLGQRQPVGDSVAGKGGPERVGALCEMRPALEVQRDDGPGAEDLG